MTFYTTTKTGNWSDTTAWTPTPPTGGPGNGDYVQLNHAITLDTAAGPSQNGAVTVGTSAVMAPTATPTVSATGGGSTGGSLAAGSYYFRYSNVGSDSTESSPSPLSAGTVSVASGNIPRVTFPALPSGVASFNLYITSGSAGTERLYCTGITGTTCDCISANWGNTYSGGQATGGSTSYASATAWKCSGVYAVGTAGSLTVASGCSLTVRGDIMLSQSTLTVGSLSTGGATLTFDASASTGTTATKYACRVGTAYGQGTPSKMQIYGTSGSHSTVSSNSGGGNGWFDDGNGTYSKAGQADCQYADFTRIGDSTNYAWRFYDNGSGLTFSWQHCTFTSCGPIYSDALLTATSTFRLAYCTFTSSQQTSCVAGNYGYTTMTSGTRSVTQCYFDKNFMPSANAGQFTFSQCIFDGGVGLGGSSGGAWTSFDSCFVRIGATGPTLYGNATNCYVVADVDGGTTKITNPHYLQLPATAGYTVDSCIFETSYSDGQGDCVVGPSSAPSSLQQYVVKRCIVLSGQVDGLGAGVVVTCAGQNNAQYTIEHNTVFVGGQPGASLCETGSGWAGQVSSFRANLFFSTSGNTDCKAWEANPSAVNDVVSATNCDYNSGYNVGTAPTTSLNTKANRYQLNLSSGTPGSHDADVLNGTIGALNPNFVDSTRRLTTWDSSLGGAGTWASARQRLQNDPTQIAALLAYVRAGFRPAQQLLLNATYPGDAMTTDAAGNTLNGTIGAMAVTNVYSVTGSGGLWGNGTALTTASYNALLASAGLWIAGSGISGGGQIYNYTGFGGLWGNDSASNRCVFAPLLIPFGAWAADAALVSSNFNAQLLSAGLLGSGLADTTNPAAPSQEVFTQPRPVITFLVQLIDWQAIFAYPQPDTLANILTQRELRYIEIPGVPQPLHDGDTFTLFGQQALEVKSAYAPYLTVLSQE